MGAGLQPAGGLVRVVLRDRSSVSHDAERVLPEAGRAVPGADALAAVDLDGETPDGGVFGVMHLRRGSVSGGVSGEADHGESAWECAQCGYAERRGATYEQHNAADFLQANDTWFMPVSQKVGPDGCLYFIDWYDRYHCYQDAGRDPQGVDRAKGRIYRVRYGDAPTYPVFDLQKMSGAELIKLLGNPNVWWRRQAQRVLNEKFDEKWVAELQRMVSGCI